MVFVRRSRSQQLPPQHEKIAVPPYVALKHMNANFTVLRIDFRRNKWHQDSEKMTSHVVHLRLAPRSPCAPPGVPATRSSPPPVVRLLCTWWSWRKARKDMLSLITFLIPSTHRSGRYASQRLRERMGALSWAIIPGVTPIHQEMRASGCQPRVRA